MSRNFNYNEASEWSCVHDIHLIDPEETDESEEEEFSNATKRNRLKRTHRESEDNLVRIHSFSEPPPPLSHRLTLAASQRPTSSGSNNEERSRPGTSNDTNRQDSFIPDIWAAEISIKDRAQRCSREQNHRSQNAYAYVYAISSGVLPILNNPAGSSRREESVTPRSSDSDSSSQSPSRGFAQPRNPQSKHHQKKLQQRIYQNAKRLLYYSEETISVKGFIKESCFSPDGRIIASPHNTGVRLLSFSTDCLPYNKTLSNTVDSGFPRQLSEVCQLNSGYNNVLCAQFNPVTGNLVTGDLGGKISWFYPKL